jgi:predicted transcriptional regulator
MAAHPLSLDPDLQQRVERAAQREVRSPKFLLRDPVELYFKVHGETDEDAALIAEHDGIWDAYDGPTITREQFLAEVQESADEYQRTGLHLTHEEVDAWLEKLQRGEDAQLPECHT